MELKTVALDNVTEKGNLRPVAAKALKDVEIAAMLDAGFELTPKGELVKAVATMPDGKTVYARVGLSISTATNLFDEPTTKATADTPALVLFD